MPGHTALLSNLTSMSRNLKQKHNEKGFHHEIHPEFPFSNQSPIVHLSSIASMLPHLKFYLHKKQIDLNYFEKLSSTHFQVCKRCWVCDLLEERQNQNKAMLPYHINHLQYRSDKSTTLVSVTARVPLGPHVRGESSCRFVTSLCPNKKNKPTKSQPNTHKITKSKA